MTPRLRESRTRGGLFLVPHRQPGWVRRTELDDVVSTLTMRASGTVGLTTGLAGAGGFGKTSLALEACHSDEVRKRFGGGVVWVTVGRDRAGADIAALANDVTEAVLGVRPDFSSPEQAGHRMAEALAERGRVLLVVDDVWSLKQLRPFLSAAARSRVLVTTRLPRALPPKAIAMIVDEMAPRVAVQVLSRGLPPMAPGVVSDLVGLTGRWPLLLSLVNARLRDEHGTGTNADVAARRAVERLGRTVPAILDVTVASQRESAVLATVELGLEALGAFDRARFLELGVFPEDVEIPAAVVELLWRGTAGLTSKQAERLCARLQDLSLISRRHARGAAPSIMIHDVVRSAVRSAGGLGEERLEAANRDFLDEARNLIPDDDLTADAEWWRLPRTVPYLWDHLLFHLSEARRYRELESLLHDVRWFVARVRAFGVAAAESDLALSTSRSVAGVRRLISRSAHLLTPFESDAVSTANLLARLYAFPPMRASVERYSQENETTFLRARWPLPDDGTTCLLRTLTSATRRLNEVSVTPDGSRFVVHARDGGAQVWKTDGTTRTTLATHGRPVHEVVVAPDGSWLVTRSGSRKVQIWGIGGTERAVLRNGTGRLAAMAVAPDGSWLVTLSTRGKGRLWNADGSRRAVLRNGTAGLAGVAVAPDGSWLATRSVKGRVALWSPGGKRRLVLRSRVRVRTRSRSLKDALRMRGWSQENEKVSGREKPIGRVSELAVSPDASWLATLSGDGSVRLWGTDGVERAVLTGHAGTGSGMRVSPDGSWLATWAPTGPVRLWEADGRQRAVLTGDTGAVRQVV
ncbi:NB-ARC domain-containing protein, partial [Streptosporangium sp. NPDC002721]|uniref:NB-ARC domain-containing protein n=1 Tax=Streptosporangium sp. NPDC002721 TaxID=3366188 RepID=UPI003689DE11